MYQIAICEDDMVFSKHLSSMVSSVFSDLGHQIDVKIFHTASSLLKSDFAFDLYFLDVMLPDKDGLFLAEKIRETQKDCGIIFVSSMNNAVFEAIHHSPIRFMRKEKLDSELEEACRAFCEWKKTIPQKNTKTIFVCQNSSTIAIPIESIRYVETKAHYLDFYCNSDIYHIRGNFNDFRDLSTNPSFGRATQSFLVHFLYIHIFSSAEITLDDGKTIPVSRSKRKSFQEKYMHYQRISHYGNVF